MPQEFTIIKNDHLGREVWHYAGILRERSPRGLLFEARFNSSDLNFNGVVLKKDDLFLELYLFEKYFNIYQIFDRDSGLLKAWYCNVCRPVVLDGNSISYDDLALDLLVYADGKQLVLDEDEFTELGLNNELKLNARQGLAELRDLFNNNHPLNVNELL